MHSGAEFEIQVGSDIGIGDQVTVRDPKCFVYKLLAVTPAKSSIN